MNDIEQRLTQFQAIAIPDFECLPLSVRLLDRLTTVIVLADQILGELATEEASPMLWVEPHVRRVYDNVDALIGRFAQ